MTRPLPPEAMADPVELFEPSEDLREWIIATFIADDGDLYNEDHRHLIDAEIGVLWTNVDNSRNMRHVIGQAELMPPMAMGKWQRARAIRQVEEWFGEMPDFLLTFYAPAASVMDDASFCALVEHELYHCAQRRDLFGMPKFTQDGRPSFAIRGHDVEEFVGVVARYGAAATGVSEMVEAANRKPSIALAEIAGACGTCALKAA
jgi:hypothetical protein